MNKSEPSITAECVVFMIRHANAILGFAESGEGVKFIGGTRGFDLRFASPPTLSEKQNLNRLFARFGFTKMRFDRESGTAAKIFPNTKG